MANGYSPLKAIGWSVAFVVLTLILTGLLAFGGTLVLTGSPEAALRWLSGTGPGPLLLQGVAMVLSGALFTWLIGVRALGLTVADLRYRVGHGGAGFGLGGLAGALAAGAGLAIAALVGGAEWSRDAGTPADYAGTVAATLLLLAPAALAEEVLFRGVPLVILAAVLGRGTAVVLIAVAFALVHIQNPNVTALGIGNIALAGIFLGLAFYAPGGIWTAWGAHLGWNATLAALDAPVSGVPFRVPFLDYEAGGPAWLTGGAFGPEGGLASTLALTIAVLVARRWAGKDPT
ncbi:MAG TPA: CPBP family intramembrane glutamic endopeptidase [Gemmatimonadales bacterium]|nr:CPBP family intramembrane glutamic endopeptidase [Gemmatimonadales bacterium]